MYTPAAALQLAAQHSDNNNHNSQRAQTLSRRVMIADAVQVHLPPLQQHRRLHPATLCF